MEKNTETTIMGMSLGDLGKYMFTMYVGPSGCEEGLGVVASLPCERLHLLCWRCLSCRCNHRKMHVSGILLAMIKRSRVMQYVCEKTIAMHQGERKPLY